MAASGGGLSLSISGVSKRYGETIALRDVSIEFTGGAVHTILGENGSGKSTLVKLLSGVVAADSGSLSINGAPLRGRDPADFAALGFATVFQEVLVAPHLSVAENILLGLDKPWRWAVPVTERVAFAQRIVADLSRTALPMLARAGDLPLAAKQIIVIARALARSPRVLVLDEATAALDHADRNVVFARIRQFAASGGLVLFISHRMDEVLSLSDRISVLRSGQLVATLPRAEARVDALLDLMAPERPRALRHA